MKLKKSLFVALILSQASLGWAGQTSAPAQATPEMNLLTSTIALSGGNLSRPQMQNQIMAEIQQYNAVAPITDRAERTEAALVDLGIYSQVQAEAFEQQLQTSISHLSTTHFASADQAAAAVEQELSKLPMPDGAQFSAEAQDCMEGLGLGVLAGAAMVFGIDYDSGPNDGLDALSVLIGIGGGAFLLLDVFTGFGCAGDWED